MAVTALPAQERSLAPRFFFGPVSAPKAGLSFPGPVSPKAQQLCQQKKRKEYPRSHQVGGGFAKASPCRNYGEFVGIWRMYPYLRVKRRPFGPRARPGRLWLEHCTLPYGTWSHWRLTQRPDSVNRTMSIGDPAVLSVRMDAS